MRDRLFLKPFFMKNFHNYSRDVAFYRPSSGSGNGYIGRNLAWEARKRSFMTSIMAYRKSKGLPPIPLSAKLSQVAQTHARDLTENYKVDASNECNPHSWSGKGTWTACCYTNDHKQAACMWRKPQEIADYPGYGYEIAYYSSRSCECAGSIGWLEA